MRNHENSKHQKTNSKNAVDSSNVTYFGSEGGHMGEWEIECLDCGRRGVASDLTEEADESGGRSPGSCPDCGGLEFEKRSDPDQ